MITPLESYFLYQASRRMTQRLYIRAEDVHVHLAAERCMSYACIGAGPSTLIPHPGDQGGEEMRKRRNRDVWP